MSIIFQTYISGLLLSNLFRHIPSIQSFHTFSTGAQFQCSSRDSLSISNRENFSSGVNNVVNDFLSNSLQMQEKQVTESELEFDRTETLQ